MEGQDGEGKVVKKEKEIKRVLRWRKWTELRLLGKVHSTEQEFPVLPAEGAIEPLTENLEGVSQILKPLRLQMHRLVCLDVLFIVGKSTWQIELKGKDLFQPLVSETSVLSQLASCFWACGTAKTPRKKWAREESSSCYRNYKTRYVVKRRGQGTRYTLQRGAYRDLFLPRSHHLLGMP